MYHYITTNKIMFSRNLPSVRRIALRNVTNLFKTTTVNNDLLTSLPLRPRELDRFDSDIFFGKRKGDCEHATPPAFIEDYRNSVDMLLEDKVCRDDDFVEICDKVQKSLETSTNNEFFDTFRLQHDLMYNGSGAPLREIITKCLKKSFQIIYTSKQ